MPASKENCRTYPLQIPAIFALVITWISNVFYFSYKYHETWSINNNYAIDDLRVDGMKLSSIVALSIFFSSALSLITLRKSMLKLFIFFQMMELVLSGFRIIKWINYDYPELLLCENMINIGNIDEKPMKLSTFLIITFWRASAATLVLSVYSTVIVYFFLVDIRTRSELTMLEQESARLSRQNITVNDVHQCQMFREQVRAYERSIFE